MKPPDVSRRALLGGLGAGGVGFAAGALALHDRAGQGTTGQVAASSQSVDFHGPHQAGIATAAQDRLAFASFDVMTKNRSELRDLLREWTAAAAAMSTGALVAGESARLDASPADTGEAVGLPPGLLTVTAGFGPSLFDRRFGLAGRRPRALVKLPGLPGDELDLARSDGDLCIQACSQDPQVAFHVIRNLARIGRGVVQMRWSQLGFGRTSATTTGQSTPRNLMGFKDGTRNVHGDKVAQMNDHIWVPGGSDQAWMAGGSYLVSRRIRMHIEGWDRDVLSDQQEIFGRTKHEGAPLTGTRESDVPDYSAKKPDGTPVIAVDSHIRLVAPENNGGKSILRRGYSYTDGIDPASGEFDAGLFFIAFMRDPQVFVDLQNKLGSQDALNEYIKHVASGVFACPGGVTTAADHWGSALFA
jgi:deferrochelatase/peroxidase EfeB